MVVSTGNAPVFLVYQTSVLLLYDKTNGALAEIRTQTVSRLRVGRFSQFSYKGIYKQIGATSKNRTLRGIAIDFTDLSASITV